jgi:hypothetical protein
MGGSLIEQLRQVKDFQVKDGQRHQLWMFMWMHLSGLELMVRF